jgi:hypothetical protein
MTFGPDHYVPVLKVKRGERKALQRISSTHLSQITPLLEIVARKPAKTLNAHLDTAFTDLAETVRPYMRCFIDAREIAADGQAGADEVFRRASDAGIVFTPVTGISRTADVVPALAHRANGLALRLTRTEFEQGGLATKINAFLRQHGLTPEHLDLIVDLGGVEDFIAEGIGALTDAFMAEVPDHQRWHTFTVSACAFPKSMGGVQRNSHAFVERAEWIAWKGNLYERRNSLQRLPTYSDCAIQRPEGVENFDPVRMQVSAAIRYTLEEEWLLIKGQSTRSKRPGEQFPALARKLVYGSLMSRFYGPDHCSGCGLMKAAADGASGLGSAEAWRQLGTIHHISVVTQGLAALPWP